MLRIKEMRKKRKISGPQLAAMLNVSTTYIYDIEKGRRRVHAEMLSKIADILGTSTDYLLGRTNDPSPPSSRKENIRKSNSDLIINLIEEVADLPEDQQELVAGHWKWALDVVRRQEEEKRKHEQFSCVTEEKTEYRPDLEKLVPRDEINLAEAMIKISNIVYEHNLTKEEATYLMHRVVDHYGKPEFPEETHEAAHGPRIPGQIGQKEEEEE